MLPRHRICYGCGKRTRPNQAATARSVSPQPTAGSASAGAGAKERPRVTFAPASPAAAPEAPSPAPVPAPGSPEPMALDTPVEDAVPLEEQLAAATCTLEHFRLLPANLGMAAEVLRWTDRVDALRKQLAASKPWPSKIASATAILENAEKAARDWEAKEDAARQQLAAIVDSRTAAFQALEAAQANLAEVQRAYQAHIAATTAPPPAPAHAEFKDMFVQLVGALQTGNVGIRDTMVTSMAASFGLGPPLSAAAAAAAAAPAASDGAQGWWGPLAPPEVVAPAAEPPLGSATPGANAAASTAEVPPPDAPRTPLQPVAPATPTPAGEDAAREPADVLPVPSSAPAAADPLAADQPTGPHLPPGDPELAGTGAATHTAKGPKVPVTPVGALLANAKRAAAFQADGVPKKGVGAAYREGSVDADGADVSASA